MDLATLSAIWTVVTQILGAVIQYGPAVISDVTTIIADLQLAWTSATSGTPITPAQQAQIDTALDNANQALAAAIAAQQAQT